MPIKYLLSTWGLGFDLTYVMTFFVLQEEKQVAASIFFRKERLLIDHLKFCVYQRSPDFNYIFV